MLQKKKSPIQPATQRTFASVWTELDYLCKKISYWLYNRKQKSGAGRYLRRLEKVLSAVPDDCGAILREEALALFNELKGHRDGAIAHRSREIELMERLHREADQAKYSVSTRAYMLQGRDIEELKKRRAILDLLQIKNGASVGQVNGKATKR